MTRMLNVNGTPAYLLDVASLEPRTIDELLHLACLRHPELLEAEDSAIQAAVAHLRKDGFLGREERTSRAHPFRYTITRAGEEEANRVYDERMKRGAA